MFAARYYEDDDIIMTEQRIAPFSTQQQAQEELSRNNRNTIKNALVEPEEALSRNNFIPSFHVSSEGADVEE